MVKLEVIVVDGEKVNDIVILIFISGDVVNYKFVVEVIVDKIEVVYGMSFILSGSGLSDFDGDVFIYCWC